MAAAAKADPLDITEIRHFPVREPVSGNRYSILKVTTRAGLIGWGECAYNSAADLRALQLAWIGRPANTYATIAGATPFRAALDIAFLDIVGKAAKAPVYRVLGGPTRNKVRAYGSVAAVSRRRDRRSGAGVAQSGQGLSEPGSRTDRPRAQRSRFRACGQRRADAGRCGLGGDFRGDETSSVVRRAVLALESRSGAQSLRRDRGSAGIRRRESTILAFFRRCCVRDWSTWSGRTSAIFGISGVRRIAALAETYYVAVAPRHDGGPVGTAAAIHIAASLPNFFIQHVPVPAAEQDRAMRREMVSPAVETGSGGFLELHEFARPRHHRERSGTGEISCCVGISSLWDRRAWRWPEQRSAPSLDSDLCGCALQPQAAQAGGPAGMQAFAERSIGPEDHRDESVRRFADSELRPAVCVRQAGDESGPDRMGRRNARRQSGRRDGVRQRLQRLPDRRGPDAGGTYLAVDVRSLLLSRRSGDGIGDLGHRPGAVGHSRQSAGDAGVQAAGRTVRSARRARLLPRRRGQSRATDADSRDRAASRASPASSPAFPGYYEWIERRPKIDRAIKSIQMLRESARPRHRYRGRLPCQDQPQRGFDHREGSGAAEPAVHRGAVSSGECSGDGEDRAALDHSHRDRRAADCVLRLPRTDRDGRDRYSADRYQSRGRHHRAVEGRGHRECFGDLDGARMRAKGRSAGWRRFTWMRPCRTSSCRRSAGR